MVGMGNVGTRAVRRIDLAMSALPPSAITHHPLHRHHQQPCPAKMNRNHLGLRSARFARLTLHRPCGDPASST